MDIFSQGVSSGTASQVTIAALLLTGLVYIFLVSSSSSPASLLHPNAAYSYSSCKQKSLRKQVGAAPAADELDMALRAAATVNQTVIIAMVNRAYVDPGERPDDSNRTMLDLFLESFWLGEDTRGLLDHVLVVAVDQTAYEMCRFRRLNCYRMETQGVDFGGEKLYMAEQFIKMMWARTLFLTNVLKRGYSFIFTDTDVMWLRNPFTRLSKNESEDLQISTDHFNGNPWSEANDINTGFYFVRTNNRTISLLETWYSMKDNSTGMKEQDVLLHLMRGGIFSRLGLGVRFLDTLYFSGFCQDSRDFAAVTTVHANCCRSINAKVHDLSAVLRDWKRYRFDSSSNRTGGDIRWYAWSPHHGCVNSWRRNL
ncbi:hypothetical protein SAY87_025288 [Trapa incisa]|uniref:Nucleotide-diphospho-sugar transferase domain-containing protein n=1 Tax=Trapa incisa TaxID=236973 RepID=A0AAN7JGF2_9MYRT|nr:hypothetical protein SAY87_025288 [Trapa incisa]